MGSKIDKTTLLSLFNGGSWNRNFKNNTTSKMSTTAFNYTGFIQPKFLVEMLQRDDQDGFNDRLMVVCPAEVLVPFKELQVPMPEDAVDLYTVFKGIRSVHAQEEVLRYRFSDEAQEAFAEMHDTLQQQKAASNDENRRGNIVKGITHLIRLAGILFVMEQAFNAVSADGTFNIDNWETTITLACLQSAWSIVNYTLKQKWALMPPCAEVYANPSSDEAFVSTNGDRIKKFLMRSDFPMSPSNALRYRCVPNSVDEQGKVVKLNVSHAEKFLARLETIGFGELRSVTGVKNKQVSKSFVKRKFQDLSSDAVEHLKKLKLSREEYEPVEKQTTNDLEDSEPSEAPGVEDNASTSSGSK